MTLTGGPAGPGRPSFPRAPWREKGRSQQLVNVRHSLFILHLWVHHSRLLQRLRDAPSHREDLGVPTAEDTSGQGLTLLMLPSVSSYHYYAHLLLLTMGPEEPFSPAEPDSP